MSYLLSVMSDHAFPRLRRRMFHHMEDEFHLPPRPSRSVSARALRFIESYCDDDEDAYRTFHDRAA